MPIIKIQIIASIVARLYKSETRKLVQQEEKNSVITLVQHHIPISDQMHQKEKGLIYKLHYDDFVQVLYGI